MVADDLVLSSRIPRGAQMLVTEAKLNTSCERLSFSKRTTRTMVTIMCTSKKTSQTQDLYITLYSSMIKVSDSKPILTILRLNFKNYTFI